MKGFDKKKIENIFYGFGADHSNRIEIFQEKHSEFTDKEFWYGLSIAYTNTDNLYPFKDAIKKIINDNLERPHRNYMMTYYERYYYNKLPDKIKLYRGMTIKEFESNEYGISWTLSKKVAEFFAFTYRRNFATNNLPKTICEKEFNKMDALCYFSSRKEKEVLIIC